MTAKRANLTFASHNKFILRADDTTVLAPDGPGRNSVRLSSKNNYTTHVAVYATLSSCHSIEHVN